MTDKEIPSFHEWWEDMADREAPTIQRKAEEYGTNSLIQMGRIWAKALDWDVTDEEAIEVGCFLYAYGKIQRVADALLKRKLPNVDSWHDTHVYAAMAMYTRETGTWPGPPRESFQLPTAKRGGFLFPDHRPDTEKETTE